MIGQRVKVEKVTDVDVSLTERILRVRPVAVGRRVYLHRKQLVFVAGVTPRRDGSHHLHPLSLLPQQLG